MNNLNIEEIKDVLNYIINNNKKLSSENKKTTAVEVMGESGIGKTSTIIQLAEELGMDCVKLNLTMLEELGDIVGYPIKEYEVCEPTGSNCSWISKDLLDAYIKGGYGVTGQHRMNYATPTWLPKTENPNGGILILDDYNRADPRFLQATMELIDRGQYISWSLPANWTIILTSNPDNGDYNVNSLDNAQKTRYISFDLDFSVDCWARWAEEEGIDSRGINFVLSYPEILNKEGGIQKINPRSLVTFFNTISGFENFSDKKTLALILNIAKGCFTSEDNVVGNLFTMFIANKLDKLMTPEDLVTKSWSSVKDSLEKCLYDGQNYRADIASVMSTRFLNYVNILFSKKGSKTEPVIERILDLIDDKNEKVLLTEDLIFNLIKTIATKYPLRTKKLLSNPKVAKKLL